MTSEDATALFHLRCLCDSASAISLADGACLRDNLTHVLTFGTPPELR